MRADISPEVEVFLEKRSPLAIERVEWGRSGDRPRPLLVTAYLEPTPPPLDFTISVRAVVLRGSEVLVMRNPDGMHVLPGGRREAGETIEETLRREVFEESGWTLKDIVPLGFAHLRHLGERPPGYGKYPFPDFFWLVFRAEADEFSPGTKDPDGYEIEGNFLPFESAVTLDLGEVNRIFLRATFSQ